MSVSEPRMSAPPTSAANSRLIRIAMWVAIGALVAAAVVCVIWVLIGPQNGIIGRAFLTILLLAAFAGAAMLDARLASSRPAWFALTSMVVWVATLLIGVFLIWVPERPFNSFGGGLGRFLSFLLVVLVLQLALLHIWLFTKALQRNRQPLVTIIGYITMGLVILLAVMLVIPLTFNEWIDFRDIYWRLVVAVTILAAVGTAIVPLINALFSPRRPGAAGRPQPPRGWPTYVDGTTPLPVLSDGSPDWNAYYTGYPSPGAAAVPTQPAAPQQWSQPQGQPQWAAAPQWPAAQTPPGQQSPQPDASPAPDQQQQSAPNQGPPPPSGYQGYPPRPPLPPQ